jgi:hypothetical protein
MKNMDFVVKEAGQGYTCKMYIFIDVVSSDQSILGIMVIIFNIFN